MLSKPGLSGTEVFKLYNRFFSFPFKVHRTKTRALAIQAIQLACL